MKVLVVGGTRFFGIPMVKKLLANGHDVTVATRGNAKADFDGNIAYITLDRTDGSSVKRALEGKHFDVVIDKIAYGSNDVKALLENVSCDRYIQMSTCSVYQNDHADITEDEFVTKDYPLEWDGRLSDYAKTKRNAERAALEFMEPSKCTFVRYPVVLGENDYTGRLRFYLEHIKDEKPMNVDDLDMDMAFIHEKEAGEFIAYLVDHPVSGPVNGCSSGAVKISEIISYAEKKLGKKAILDASGEEAPYNGLTDTLSFSTKKANEAGYTFSALDSWLYKLIDFEVAKMTFGNVKWLFFDVGSTLVSEEKPYFQRLNEIAEAVNESFESIQSKVLQLYKEKKKGEHILINDYGIERPRWRTEDEELYPESYECLEKLSKKYKIGVIANQVPGTAERLEKHGVLKFIDLVIASAEEGLEKPDRRIFELALSRANCRPENAVMIGDRVDNDIIPAKEIGMKTVRVNQGMWKYWEVSSEAEQADFEVNNLSEVLKLF